MNLNEEEIYSPIDIESRYFDAVLFDLDGVVTQTAMVHALSWKKLFDQYLEKLDKDNAPFDISRDYRLYVDGKPRYEGVRSFLESRDINLPYGTPSDPPGKETICGLGNLKNLIFQEVLEQEGVPIYRGAVALIGLMKRRNLKIGLVTSSKNARLVVKKAKLESLFDYIADGVELERLGLKGKPHPDLFLHAAQKLKAPPSRSIIFEDAESGVEAGRRGNFGMVVGVDRTGHGTALLEKGAHVVAFDLSRITVDGKKPDATVPIKDLPDARKAIGHIKLELLFGKEPFVALDYDGTLTPIVERPELAILSEKTRKTLKKLKDTTQLAIISGRDLKDVKRLVKVDGIIYAGSHGFDIESPTKLQKTFKEGEAFIAELNEAEKALRERTKGIDGLLIERKKYSIAVHFRLVKPEMAEKIEKEVDQVVDAFASLKKTFGKKVFEVRPNMDWDKGKAIEWLVEALGFSRHNVLPIYVGDDVTDEDGFKALIDWGIGIVVAKGKDQEKSAASYKLPDTESVEEYLKGLAELFERRG
jgi:alpha,alpha-trehalase